MSRAEIIFERARVTAQEQAAAGSLDEVFALWENVSPGSELLAEVPHAEAS